jgi:hypothetical protein
MAKVDRLELGMTVQDLGEQSVGVVGEVEAWGFLIELPERRRPVWLTPTAIFHVANGVVTLICNRPDLARYEVPRSGELASSNAEECGR